MSSFSKREKMRQKPLSLRKNRSISFRFLYRGRSYSDVIPLCEQMYGATLRLYGLDVEQLALHPFRG